MTFYMTRITGPWEFLPDLAQSITSSESTEFLCITVPHKRSVMKRKSVFLSMEATHERIEFKFFKGRWLHIFGITLTTLREILQHLGINLNKFMDTDHSSLGFQFFFK